MKRLYPEWWLGLGDVLVQNKEQGMDVACALFRELEGLAKSNGFELIVLAQHLAQEAESESVDVEKVLGCLSDPATRVLDLKTAFSQMKAEDPSGYSRLFYSRGRHMTPEGNHFVAVELNKILAQ
jgi:hypothetical protein